jgi:hypothetical protein
MTQDDSTEPMSVDMTVKISLDPQDMHEIFNLTLHIGMPWGRSFTSLIASLPQFERPELVVSFPPDGYEFGTITNPFVMCHVQVTCNLALFLTRLPTTLFTSHPPSFFSLNTLCPISHNHWPQPLCLSTSRTLL